MNKWEALQTYLGATPNLKPKYVKQHICHEACDMIKEWKEDHFAPSVSELNGLDGDNFLAVYDEKFYKTCQHEGAEIIERVDIFFQSHGIDIFEYYEKLKLKRKYKMDKWQPKVKVVIPVKI